MPANAVRIATREGGLTKYLVRRLKHYIMRCKDKYVSNFFFHHRNKQTNNEHSNDYHSLCQ